MEIDRATVVLVRWRLGFATQWTPNFREMESDSESLAKCESQSLACDGDSAILDPGEEESGIGGPCTMLLRKQDGRKQST